jgi:hypothetical protein
MGPHSVGKVKESGEVPSTIHGDHTVLGLCQCRRSPTRIHLKRKYPNKDGGAEPRYTVHFRTSASTGRALCPERFCVNHVSFSRVLLLMTLALELQHFSTEACHFLPLTSLEAMPRGIQHQDVTC